MTKIYKALDMLRHQYQPTRGGREPFWRPKAAPVADRIHVPTWNWQVPEVPGTFLDLDTNGAYLAACASADFGFGKLEHTGPGVAGALSGYYLVDAHAWPEGGIPSPLGTNSESTGQIWIALPTVRLLDRLSVEGYWPEVIVHDSWTAAESMRFRKWTDAVKADRLKALQAIEATQELTDARTAALDVYEAIKDGYSMAVQMWLGPAEGEKRKSDILRPDWYHTAVAQHAGSTWRRAWNCTLAGHAPVALGDKDEMTLRQEDFDALRALPKPVFRFDQTKAAIGALKVKTRHTVRTVENIEAL